METIETEAINMLEQIDNNATTELIILSIFDEFFSWLGYVHVKQFLVF